VDEGRIKGSAKPIGGSIGQAAGKLMGDVKLAGDCKTDKAAGKLPNAQGGTKDKLRQA
jgi:uncharacterized protein YjbJ (UPF0337 family)